MPDLTREDFEEMLSSQKGPSLDHIARVVALQIKDNKLPLKLEKREDRYILVDIGESTEAWLGRFITQDPAMRMMKDDVRKLAKVEEDIDQLFAVLIQGDSGTGKEMIARALHGERDSDTFVAINCAGLPSELVESELFGHVKGAFTHAIKDKEGLMRMANKGTLFLDEVGELPLQVQAKLLRAIQNKNIRKVGGEKDEKISCRIVCATHRDLVKMCREGTFREDLYARISTYILRLTPLSARIDDVMLIMESINGGTELIQTVNSHNLPVTEDDYINLKDSIHYPFNVRSIQQMIKRHKTLGRLP